MLTDRSILIVEDNVFLALDLSNAVEGVEGRIIGPAATAATALQLVETCEISAAVIAADLVDVDLPLIVMRLAERKVPIVLRATAWLPPEVAEILPDVPVLLQPVRAKTVVAQLIEEIERRSSQAGDVSNRES